MAKKCWTLILCAAMTLAGCQRNEGSPVAVVPKPKLSLADWQAGLQALQTITKRTVDKDGVVRFSSCFSASCELPLKGDYDPFSKVTTLEGGNSMPNYKDGHGLSAAVVVADCGAPQLALRPSYFGKEWLYMNQLAVMADGEVSLVLQLDRPLRDTTAAGVMELATVTLSGAQLAQLRRIAIAKEVMVRLSGERGLNTLTSRPMKAFLTDLPQVLAVYDAVANYAATASSRCSSKVT